MRALRRGRRKTRQAANGAGCISGSRVIRACQRAGSGRLEMVNVSGAPGGETLCGCSLSRACLPPASYACPSGDTPPAPLPHPSLARTTSRSARSLSPHPRLVSAPGVSAVHYARGGRVPACSLLVSAAVVYCQCWCGPASVGCAPLPRFWCARWPVYGRCATCQAPQLALPPPPSVPGTGSGSLRASCGRILCWCAGREPAATLLLLASRRPASHPHPVRAQQQAGARIP